MKKTLLFIALLAVVGAAAAGYFLYLEPRAQRTAYTTEGALPSAPDADYTVALKLTDMSSLKSLVASASSLISDFQPVLDSLSRQKTAADIKASMDGLGALLDTVTEMSILAARRQSSTEGYISLLADGAAFSRAMSEMSSEFYAVEKWDAGITDSEGWSVKSPANGFAMYVLKRDGAENSQILAAGTEEAVSAMLSAADGKSPRFSPERTTSGVNFFQVRLKNGFTYGMLDELLTSLLGEGTNNTGRELIKENGGRVIFTVYEYSDTRNGNVVTAESYSDAMEKNPGLAARHPKSAAAPQLMGDGELVYFLAFDTGLILSSIFPGAEDPAEGVFELLGDIPMFYNDLKAIISSARVSIACVAKDKKLNTAYILIETDSPESLGKLYSMVGFLGLPAAELPGWESAVSTPIPDAGPLVQNAVLAHRKGAFLSGIGTVADFAKSPAIREEYKEFMSQDDIVNGVVSSKLYDILLDMTQDLLAAAQLGTSASDETAIAAIAAIRDSFDFICVKLNASGKGYEKYNLTRDGSLTEAMFKVISNTALRMIGSAADPAE